jgi:CRISPR-associated endonuclease/helicase Cas3
MMIFEHLFETATGHAPYDYQRRLAGGDAGRPCTSQLIHVPTGLGKTAAVVLAWLWHRVAPSLNSQPATLSQPWPRRLVYCLPMRTLVEQTRDNVANWLENLAKAYPDNPELKWLAEHSPVVLMGGEELEPAKRGWDLYPERPCILVGTQDMLLSRALNRGYGMSRYRWPMHFGLLNNDALWVLDETQLMGVGVETSAQLDGFRHKAANSVVGACPTWWMSATLDAHRLATVDHPQPDKGWPTIRLEPADRQQPEVRDRLQARKPLSPAPIKLTNETNKAYPRDLASLVKEKHVPGTLTLVVVNTVARAREIFVALRKLGTDDDCLALIHSRFRAADRAVQQAKLLAEGDRIVVATQAVEAGMDVSARLLVTELAPWSSLVQRFGRCNRRGEFATEAEILWVDVPKDEKDDLALPYDATELNAACDALKTLDNASSELLQSITVSPRRVVRPVLRRKDLIELFDTTPDLCGADTDIARFVRDGEDNDVRVFWREWEGDQPCPRFPAATRDELCAVAVHQFRAFLKHKSNPAAYAWDALAETWQRVWTATPGRIYLLDVSAGGYSRDLGWTGNPKDKVEALSSQADPEERYAADEPTFINRWVELGEHTADVGAAAEALTKALRLAPDVREALHTAALWHDIGKVHFIFQEMLTRGAAIEDQGKFWAKSERTGGKPTRPGFRHELASALAWLQTRSTEQQDLVAFLVAAHHGKVRLSIRSLPIENQPAGEAGRLYARGVWDGDPLPAATLNALSLPGVKLDLRPMLLGDGPQGASWLTRMIGLRDRLGPFPLAYLETLLRAADSRASAAEATLAKPADSSDGSSDMALHEDVPPHDSTTVLSPEE